MNDLYVWSIVVALGAGTFLIRFLFIGFVGDRPLPPWALRHLRYTGVGVLPALVAPLVVWPEATGGAPDPVRLIAGGVALAVGMWRRDTIQAVIAGGLTVLLLSLLS
ncbi:AzlD domain-containing protein [uncultured Jannaschia sp.]|uniref:AzlD domain-containing protein n=1 Tax=uncultured Jannaschia sp. TaxID=293347 RepID=UPI0026303E87|nr:AzlD domain-containing protein [uncultured Jannaschia sp.]